MTSSSSEIDFDLNSYDYCLPENMIAQTPVEPRDSSKLMVLSRNGIPIADDITRNLKKHISANTAIIINDVKVIPGRFFVKKTTGGKVEVLILSILDESSAEILLQSRRPIKKGDNLYYKSTDIDFSIEILSDTGKGGIRIGRFTNFNLTPENLLRIGLPPLPPYIKRDEKDSRFENDKHRYQTIYAEKGQAAAAPTAGLHFTQNMIDKLADDFEIHRITLNVGLGT
ncbi:MAG: S-adenosylmethionine:tRNA ribosyltransferase-isomerase, partial [Planctomycetes bacterium]|nr:S-adenosylmethionine:tRNA ribosyltransferase-isomerase [Planctomycetota bacterium]